MAKDPQPAHGFDKGVNAPHQKEDRTTMIKALVREVDRTGDEIICEILPDGGSSATYVRNNLITLPAGEGPFRIRFRLEGLAWDPDHPIATAKGKCPAGKKANENEQIFFQLPNDRDLTIINLNAGDACQVHYRMNFDDGTYCDPIMDNGGNSRI